MSGLLEVRLVTKKKKKSHLYSQAWRCFSDVVRLEGVFFYPAAGTDEFDCVPGIMEFQKVQRAIQSTQRLEYIYLMR